MDIKKEIDRQVTIIKRGVSEIISEEELAKKIEKSLQDKKPLIVKAGFDPTAPDIHLGHTVLLRKLRHFQDLGHKVVFLIGDYTALIGDPSGQSQTRKVMTHDEVEKNAKTYIQQISRILNVEDAKVFSIDKNSRWFGSKEHFSFENFLVNLASRYTVARLIERDDFSKRLKENKPLTVLEMIYPLMQGYDSVVLKADIELGGTDQKFNLLVGRDLQREEGQEPQVVITTPLLVGTDGINKMSKSLNNYIGINEEPAQIFGKVMSISDELMWNYYELLTNSNLEDVKKAHPLEAKKNLASQIIKNLYSEKDALAAKADFEKKFQKKELPDEIESIKIPKGSYSINQIFDKAKDEFKKFGIVSRSELLRKLKEGAIDVDGRKIDDANQILFEGGRVYTVRFGKHRFFKIDLS